MIKNNKENSNKSTTLCVKENISKQYDENLIINKVINMYENGEFKDSDFIPWEESKRRLMELF